MPYSYKSKMGRTITTGNKYRPKSKPAIARSRKGRRTIAARSGYRGPAGDAKYVDYAANSYACDTTGTITHMSIVPQGSTVNERDGKAFRVTSIALRGVIQNGSTAVLNNTAVLIVWDKQPNKALAAITDVLDSASSTSLNKRENSARFVVIRRIENILTGKGDGTSTSGFAENFDYYIKLPKDCICECTGADTTGEIGNRISGALLMITVGGSAAGNGAALMYAAARVNFQDI